MHALRLVRYGAEVVVVTVALWIPMCAVSTMLTFRLLALLYPLRPAVNSTPSELPFVVCFCTLILANYLAQSIVKRLERFWERRGW